VRGVCLSCWFYVFFSFFRGGALLLRNPPRPATLKPELRHSYAMCGVSSVVATHFSPMLRMLSSLFRSQKHTVCFSPCMCVSLFFLFLASKLCSALLLLLLLPLACPFWHGLGPNSLFGGTP